MVVIVPVVVMMPAMIMFIPPLLAFPPAVLPGFMQFMSPAVGLPAVIAMVLNGLVEFVFRVNGAPVADIVSHGARRQEQQGRSQCGKSQETSYG